MNATIMVGHTVSDGGYLRSSVPHPKKGGWELNVISTVLFYAFTDYLK